LESVATSDVTSVISEDTIGVDMGGDIGKTLTVVKSDDTKEERVVESEETMELSAVEFEGYTVE